MTKKIVVALGGNAILTDDASASGQYKALQTTARQLITLVQQGYQLIISHGNGPQVGNLLLQQSAADSLNNPAMPLDTCVAMTQGSIGYWLQKALTEALVEARINKQLVTILTQVVVDPADPAFSNPSKPVGPFLTEEEASQLARQTGDKFIEDAGRGHRKVVPSPRPINIVEADILKSLIAQDVITISAGGGGIPVKEVDFGYEGLEAVIDKDFASAKLADLVEADILLILTAVDNVYLNYNQANQEKLEEVSVAELAVLIEDNQFAKGSMLPKVQAAIDFVSAKDDRQAVITSLENLEAYLAGGSATVIKN